MSDAPPGKPPAYVVLAPGTTVAGRYLIESVIGEGAHSVVYLARRERPPPQGSEDSVDEDADSDKVALKVIHRHLCGDPQISRRFRREAEILTRLLQGPHVVKIFDVIEDEGILSIALEYVPGRSLEAHLRAAAIGLDDAVEITLQICAALGAAHASGIIHRDLKPANVLITERPRVLGASPHELRVKVVDFGLSRLVRGERETMTSLTEQGMIFGTPEYMSPEQARGDDCDARSDIYAAGVILFEMAVGQLPFKDRSAIGAMAAHLSEAPPSPRALRRDGRVSPSLEAIILRALAKDPADRYASARDFAAAIAGAGKDGETYVITPARGIDAELLGAGDTDLHLAPPSLATAKTVPVFEVSPDLRAQLAQADVALAARAVPPAPPPPRPTTPTAIPDTLLSPTYDPPPRSRWLWAIVALLAAAIGVVIGAIAGAR